MSIQSSVAYGHVGNSAAVFPLQRLGHEVWPVLTVHFSNHTGYGAWRGPLFDPDDVREVIAGIGDRGVLGECDAVLSGYQGDPAVGAVILDAVATVKTANPEAVYCCDPVMGDVGHRVEDHRPHCRVTLVAGQHRVALAQHAAVPDAGDHLAHVRRVEQRTAPRAVPGVVGEVHGQHRPDLVAQPLQGEDRRRVADVSVGHRGLDRQDLHGAQSRASARAGTPTDRN